MKKRSKTVSVKGGSITRDAATGRFIEVATPNGVSRVSQKTLAAIKAASYRHRAALKRLANR